ncbi:LysR family transcriptional regulator substrate-binding protein [Microbacterium oxydans]|uniref:LysR substrate binding domain protein n=1 Tax=Microbacterium oxydans TaxID=82380 RepID=A0A0F0L9R5_9MICO|nr:LysR family transcriptional regulator substrate-binding protein [Microbacterium oxydans]KJL29873.1 LysR substrate binding domain protein [Microbacterium oxydans]
MATQGRRPARRTTGGPARQGKQQGKGAQPKGKRTPAKAKVVFDAPRDAPEEPRVFRLATVPGTTPGKWVDAWKQRMPHVRLELVPVEAGAEAGVEAGDRHSILADVDAALLRLPLEDDSLHIIALYDEVPVVVAAADSHLLAVDELSIADLSGEVVIVPSDDVLGPIDLPGTTPATFEPLPTAEAIVTAASGVGIVIVPMSLARLHHRKDAGHRRLLDGPTSTVALVWPRDRTTPDVETFVGIVRGRTSNSSR